MAKRPPSKHLTFSRRSLVAGMLLMAISLGATEADAAYRRAGRRAFLQVGDLYQRIALGYDFANQASSSASGDNSSTSHVFDERYSLGFAWVLYNPRILKGQLSFTGNLNQSFASSSNGASSDSNGNALFYRLEGVLLEPRPYPVRFSLFADENQVRNSFSPSYTISTEVQSVSFNLKNRHLPVSASYSQATSTSKVGGEETTSDSKTYNLGVGHGLKWSDTSFAATLEKQTIEGTSGASDRIMNRTTFDLHNVLHRENRIEKRRELTSRYRYQQEKGTDPFQRQQLQEHLSVELGRGFRVNGAYSVGSDRTENGFSRRRGGSASVTHTLYQNLRTTLSGTWSSAETSSGESSSSTGALALTYSKILPDDGNLSLGYGVSRSLNDQTYYDSTVPVDFEEYTIPAAATLPDPATYEFSLGLDVVHDVTTDIIVRDATRTWTYQEGVDYEVVQLGNDTTIRIIGLPRGGLFPINYGSTLLVSYRRRVNSQISYTSVSQSVSATLSRKGGRYVLGFDASRTTGEQRSGSDALGQTNDSLSVGLRGILNLGNTRYYGIFRHVDAAGAVSDTLSGTWSHQRTTNYGSASISATDTFTRSSSSRGGSRWANAASASAAFNRTIYRRIGMKLDGRYENRLDDDGMRHRLNLGADFKTRYGRAWISLGVNTSFSLYKSTYTRNSNLFLNYSRTF